MNKEEQQAIALAATIQALSIVHEVATEGKFDETRAQPLLQALVTYSPDNTLIAYGGEGEVLSHGVSQLKKMFSESLNRDVAQYLLSVITIELKLARNVRMRQLLQSEVQRISGKVGNNQADNFSDGEVSDSDDDNEVAPNKENTVNSLLVSKDIISDFAELYKQTASQTEPRIMIKGNHQFLQQENSANQIRALLLAAIRGASFFRHYGGKRLDLMLKRNQYIQVLDKL